MATAEVAAVAAFAPAKVNLALHVTGRRDDGYHLLDSLVVFADVGDRLRVSLADVPSLTVAGPRGAGIPTGPGNLCLRAAAFFGASARITLEKNLPAEAGIGGGSSDAAAVLRALAQLTGRTIPPGAEALGADVPVCIPAVATRMRGIGEVLTPVPDLPPLAAVLVNPGVSVPTPEIFRRLQVRDTPPLPDIPALPDAAAVAGYLKATRNDLEPPARAAAPVIGEVVAALDGQPGCLLARMSGSGATCFGLYPDPDAAGLAARAIAEARPEWWVTPTILR
ncbi:4-(cytidine 5'-diphospho)-2-C-methyl-D-erythritol kinase [Pseudooceanicola sp. LIPI14-2-Ac024]|uniref:4-(cytidine 5'-diphospho)-2-C-methyl-D-erythritol kinase n=1 Tax=Pseudooceanicola sp. LIPI14-2-Ac024 TaxID=3344875 RepID=UPI0035D07FDC